MSFFKPKHIKEGKLLRQNRKLEYIAASAEPRPGIFDKLAAVYIQKQEHDKQALEQMVAYARSGLCRWKLLLDYFGDAAAFLRCCTCDNCQSPPALAAPISLDEFPPAPAQVPAPAPAPQIAVGSRVRVPRYQIGTVLSVAGDQVTIAFPENTTRTFMAEFVVPA